MDDRIKHLEFIQNTITRMNTNSFQIKGWTITIISAILAVYATTKNDFFILLGIFPTLMFWFLDTYYLTLERKFRGLYDDVAGISEKQNQIKPFAMKTDLYVKGMYSYCDVFWSSSIWKIYIPIILMLIGIFAYLKSK